MNFSSVLQSAREAVDGVRNYNKDHAKATFQRVKEVEAGTRPMPEVNKVGVAVLIGSAVLGAVVAGGVVHGMSKVGQSFLNTSA